MLSGRILSGAAMRLPGDEVFDELIRHHSDIAREWTDAEDQCEVGSQDQEMEDVQAAGVAVGITVQSQPRIFRCAVLGIGILSFLPHRDHDSTSPRKYN